MPSLQLVLQPQELTICRFAPEASIPESMTGGSFYSETRTAEEISVVVASDRVPDSVPQSNGPWRLLSVVGPLDFELVGILASLLVPLAQARVSVFPIATYDTDHILVPGAELVKAVAALREAGFEVREQS